MRKLLLVPAFIMGLAVVSFAGNPKEETKDAKSETKTASVETPTTNTTVMESTAVFRFIGDVGDDVNDPDNYETTPLTGTPCSGSLNRCAATFDLDGSGQRTGNPHAPISLKNN